MYSNCCTAVVARRGTLLISVVETSNTAFENGCERFTSTTTAPISPSSRHGTGLPLAGCRTGRRYAPFRSFDNVSASGCNHRWRRVAHVLCSFVISGLLLVGRCCQDGTGPSWADRGDVLGFASVCQAVLYELGCSPAACLDARPQIRSLRLGTFSCPFRLFTASSSKLARDPINRLVSSNRSLDIVG